MWYMVRLIIVYVNFAGLKQLKTGIESVTPCVFDKVVSKCTHL